MRSCKTWVPLEGVLLETLWALLELEIELGPEPEPEEGSGVCVEDGGECELDD